MAGLEGTMKPAPFEYHAPESVDDALALLAEHGDDAKPLAGGQSLVPMLALRLTRFEHLVDLNRIDELRGIERADTMLAVAAMTRQAAVERDQQIADAAPLLARATSLIGHFQIRNRGTVGGSLAHADPASEYPAVALALGAELEVARLGGRRTVAADDFFAGTWTTCLEPDEVLVRVQVPVRSRRSGFAIEELTRRLGDFALAGAACAIQLDDRGRIARAGVGLFGVAGTPVRARAVEEALAARSVGDVRDGGAARELGELATRDLDPPDDVHASGRFRRTVTARLVARALGRALTEAADA